MFQTAASGSARGEESERNSEFVEENLLVQVRFTGHFIAVTEPEFTLSP